MVVHRVALARYPFLVPVKGSPLCYLAADPGSVCAWAGVGEGAKPHALCFEHMSQLRRPLSA